MIDPDEIYDLTDGGFQIFEHLLGNDLYKARKSISSSKISFCIDGEKNASAGLVRAKSGLWILTVFNADAVPRTAIRYWMHTRNVTFPQALREIVEEMALPVRSGDVVMSQAAVTYRRAPAGKTCYRLDVQGIDLTPDGMADYAYRQNRITQTNHGWTLTAQAHVGPSGALGKAQATVSKSNPKYGEQIVFQAIETHPDQWRFSHWGTDVTKKDNPLYVTATPDTVEQTAMFADASKIVDFSIKAYVENGRVKAEVRTLQNRSNQFVMVSFDIYYTYHGETMSIRYSREVTLDGRVSAYVFQDTQAGEVNYIDNMDIPLLNPWVLGQVETEIGQPTVFMRDSLDAGYSPWSVTADDDDGG